MTIHFSAYRFLDPSERRAVQERRWVVDCFEMKLFQGGTDELRYSGPGVIRHNSDGQLEYVLYDTTYREETTAVVKLISGGGDPPLGEFLEPHHLFRLEANAYDGRRWVADRIDAGTNTFADRPGARVHGDIDVLVCEFETKGPDQGAMLWTACDADLPANAATEIVTRVAGRESTAASRNVWVFPTHLGTFTLTAEAGGLQARLSSGCEEMPSDLALRLEEAFSFALASRIQWLLEEVAAQGRARVVVRSLNTRPVEKSRVGPPVRVDDEAAASALAQLVDRFLKHTSAAVLPIGHRHPLAVSVLSVLRGSRSVIEDEALTLCVEIESLATRSFAHEALVPEALRKDVDSLMKHVKEWKQNQGIRDRALNAIGKIKASDTSTILKNLAEKGWIDQRAWNEWRIVRNKFAHGLKAVDDHRALVRSCRVLYQLFLILIAKVIGYEGILTDYTAVNWPTREAPVPHLAATPAPDKTEFDSISGPNRDGEVM